MKTSQDPRHQHRIDRMQAIFSQGFQNGVPEKHVSDIFEKTPLLDQKIQKAAPEWSTDKIAKIDLAILRLAVFELAVERTQPPKVIIDEAIELAKEFGNEASPQFVNGVLGTILKTIPQQEVR